MLRLADSQNRGILIALQWWVGAPVRRLQIGDLLLVRESWVVERRQTMGWRHHPFEVRSIPILEHLESRLLLDSAPPSPLLVDLQAAEDSETGEAENRFVAQAGLFDPTRYDAAYAAEVTSLGPVAYYRLNETQATAAHDSSPNGLDGVFEGTPALGAIGAFGAGRDLAVEFDGDDYIEVPHDPRMHLADEVSVSAWINVASFEPGKEWMPVVYRGGGSLFTRTYALWVHKDGAIAWGTGDGTAYDGLRTSPGSVGRGKWHHVAAVIQRSGGTEYLAIYIDGAEAVREDSLDTTPPSPIGASLYVGWTNEVDPSYAHFSGVLDEVAVYPRALTGDEIARLHVAGTGLRVTEHSLPNLAALRTNPLESFTVTFCEPVDFQADGTGSFWLDDIAVIGPNGTENAIGIAPQGGDGSQFTISLPAQTIQGDYTITIGPDIAAVRGNPMDQDGDGQFGEGMKMRFASRLRASTRMRSSRVP